MPLKRSCLNYVSVAATQLPVSVDEENSRDRPLKKRTETTRQRNDRPLEKETKIIKLGP